MNNMSQEWVRTQWNKKISKAELYTHNDQASNQWTSQFLETGNDVAIGQLLGEKIRCSAHTFEQYMKNYSYLTSKQDMQLKIIFEQIMKNLKVWRKILLSIVRKYIWGKPT